MLHCFFLGKSGPLCNPWVIARHLRVEGERQGSEDLGPIWAELRYRVDWEQVFTDCPGRFGALGETDLMPMSQTAPRGQTGQEGVSVWVRPAMQRPRLST